MHRRKTLILSIVCAVLTVTVGSAQQFALMWILAALSLLLLSLAVYKYYRDHRIVAQARLESTQASQVSHTIPMTSKGSRRLFVPPPLN